MDWVALLIQIVVSAAVIAPVLWMAGRLLSGKEKAKLTDAIWIVILGVVIGTFVGNYLTGWLGWLGAVIMFVIWLGLIKHFFDCGWIKAFVIALIANIIYIIVWFILEWILALFGITATPPPLF